MYKGSAPELKIQWYLKLRLSRDDIALTWILLERRVLYTYIILLVR